MSVCLQSILYQSVWKYLMMREFWTFQGKKKHNWMKKCSILKCVIFVRKKKTINSSWHLLLQKFCCSVCQWQIWQLCHCTELCGRCCERLSDSQEMVVLDRKGKCVHKKMHSFVYQKNIESICIQSIRPPLNQHGQMKKCSASPPSFVSPLYFFLWWHKQQCNEPDQRIDLH